MKHTIFYLCLGVVAMLLLIAPINSRANPIITVRGLVTDTDGTPVDNLDVTVTNPSRNLTQTAITGESGVGIYSVVFIDFFGSVADVGEEIRVSVLKSGQVVAEASHTITAEDIEQAGAVIDLRIEEKSDPPLLTSVEPGTDVVTGGAMVRITGGNFLDGATVTIGGNAATEVTFVSSTELTVTIPSSVVGPADVVVTNPDGQSVTLDDGFTYTHLPPIALAIDQTTGPVTGGTAVTITGANFQEEATVRFGENEATEVTFVSETQLTAVAPPGDVGEAIITVINPDGQEVAVLIAFSYRLLPPIVTSIAPDSTTTAGGELITLTGEHFLPGLSVKFGGNEASEVVVASDTEIMVTAPPGEVGELTVTITNPDGQSAETAFTYVREPRFADWDVNEDGVTNVFDLVLVGRAFGQSGEGISGDVNKDSVVNIFDLVLVGTHFGEISTPASPPLNLVETGDGSLNSATQQRPSATAIDASSRLRAALTELEHLSDTSAEMQFVATLLRQWLIDSGEIPSQTQLLPNYPNPFNPETWIPYQLAQATEVQISIYNIIGKKVRSLAVGFKHAGMYRSRSESAYWDGRNDAGETVTSGVYFYMLHAGSFNATRKMIVLK